MAVMHSHRVETFGDGVMVVIVASMEFGVKPLAFLGPWISCALFVIVALIWLIPDRRLSGNTVHEEA